MLTALKKDKWYLLLLAAAHFLWFAASVWIWQKPYSYDSTEYIQMAVNLKHGLYYSGNAALPYQEHFRTLRPPVYPAFILLCWTVAGYHTWFILLVQNIISLCSCLLIRDTFSLLFPGTGRRWIYWLLILLYPMQMVFANMIFSDILLQFFLALYLRQLLFFLTDRAPRRILPMSLWLIAGVFTKPILYPFVFLHAAGIVFWCLRSKKLRYAFAGMLPMCCILAYGFWNRQQTGIYHISSVQPVNMLHYNLQEYYVYRYGTAGAKERMKGLLAEAGTATSFPEYYALSGRIASRELRKELGGYTVFHMLKSIQLFFDPNKLEFDIFSRRFRYKNNYQQSFVESYRAQGIKGAWLYLKDYPFLPLLLLTPLFGLFRVAGLLLFLFRRGINLQLRILLSLFIAYFALITGPVANARYFLPLLLVTSACAWIGFAGLRRGKALPKTNRLATT